jgi:hypothetical protein
MQRLTSIAFRTLFFFGFLILLPILALPRVASLVDKLLYDDEPTVVKAPVVEMVGQQVVEPQFSERVSPARFEESLVEDPGAAPRRSEGLDALGSLPPNLSPLPTYVPSSAPPAAQPSTPADKIDDAVVQRLEQIRTRLEALGATYMILEESGASNYRFLCNMQIDPRSMQVQAFHATSPSALEAAETVLRQVEGWRQAAQSLGTRLQ